MLKVEIYTDGACKGNPGRGGWGAILICMDRKKILNGSKELSTNNEMELTAVVEALSSIKNPCEITLYTDSKYVVEGVNSWRHSWKQNNWKNSQKKQIANYDLWLKCDELVEKLSPKLVWVKGHNGNFFNEEVDKIASNSCS
jgi:ribonuclease HI